MTDQKQEFVEQQIYLNDPKITEEEKRRHIERYEFVKKFLHPHWIILDASCGSGYGSEILAKKVKKVIGIDINSEALNYAKKNHYQKNIEYLKADLNQKLNFPDESFNAIVSLETIEHLKEQQIMLSEFKRILRKGGLLIISTPDKIITERENVENPYHFREFTKKEFLSLLNSFFKIEGLYGQTEYKFLPKWQRYLKSFLIKIDFLKFRKLILRRKLKNHIKRKFDVLVNGPITKIDIKDPSKHWVLIAICKKL